MDFFLGHYTRSRVWNLVDYTLHFRDADLREAFQEYYRMKCLPFVLLVIILFSALFIIPFNIYTLGSATTWQEKLFASLIFCVGVLLYLVSFLLFYFQSGHHEDDPITRNIAWKYIPLLKLSLVTIFAIYIMLFAVRGTLVANCDEFPSYLQPFLIGWQCSATAGIATKDHSTIQYENIAMIVFLPILTYFTVQAPGLDWVIFMLGVTNLLYLWLAIYYEQYKYMWTVFAWTLIVTAFLVEVHFQRLCDFYYWYDKLQKLEQTKEKYYMEQRIVEFRNLISNIVLDIKAPLSAQTATIDSITHKIQSVEENIQSIRPVVQNPAMRLIQTNVKDIQQHLITLRLSRTMLVVNIHSFVDYVRTIQGVPLSPKDTVIHGLETIQLVVDCMNTIQHKCSIRLILDPTTILSSSTFLPTILTDSQWLQENLLLLLSNAVKYTQDTAEGQQQNKEITVTISLKARQTANISTLTRKLSHQASMYTLDMRTRQASSLNLARANPSAPVTTSNGQNSVGVPTVEEFVLFGNDDLEANYATSNGNGGNNKKPFATSTARAGSWNKVVPGGPAADDSDNINQSSPQNKNTLQNAATTFGSGKNKVHVTTDPVPGPEPAQSPTRVPSQQLPNSHLIPPAMTNDTTGLIASYLRIEVEDHGIGISRDIMPFIFTPFKLPQRHDGGTGLGLYSLAKRVETYAGRCGVSGRVDKHPGTLIWFEIPYQPIANANINSNQNKSVLETLPEEVDTVPIQSEAATPAPQKEVEPPTVISDIVPQQVIIQEEEKEEVYHPVQPLPVATTMLVDEEINQVGVDQSEEEIVLPPPVMETIEIERLPSIVTNAVVDATEEEVAQEDKEIPVIEPVEEPKEVPEERIEEPAQAAETTPLPSARRMIIEVAAIPSTATVIPTTHSDPTVPVHAVVVAAVAETNIAVKDEEAEAVDDEKKEEIDLNTNRSDVVEPVVQVEEKEEDIQVPTVEIAAEVAIEETNNTILNEMTEPTRIATEEVENIQDTDEIPQPTLPSEASTGTIAVEAPVVAEEEAKVVLSEVEEKEQENIMEIETIHQPPPAEEVEIESMTLLPSSEETPEGKENEVVVIATDSSSEVVVIPTPRLAEVAAYQQSIAVSTIPSPQVVETATVAPDANTNVDDASVLSAVVIPEEELKETLPSVSLVTASEHIVNPVDMLVEEPLVEEPPFQHKVEEVKLEAVVPTEVEVKPEVEPPQEVAHSVTLSENIPTETFEAEEGETTVVLEEPAVESEEIIPIAESEIMSISTPEMIPVPAHQSKDDVVEDVVVIDSTESKSEDIEVLKDDDANPSLAVSTLAVVKEVEEVHINTIPVQPIVTVQPVDAHVTIATVAEEEKIVVVPMIEIISPSKTLAIREEEQPDQHDEDVNDNDDDGMMGKTVANLSLNNHTSVPNSSYNASSVEVIRPSTAAPTPTKAAVTIAGSTSATLLSAMLNSPTRPSTSPAVSNAAGGEPLRIPKPLSRHLRRQESKYYTNNNTNNNPTSPSTNHNNNNNINDNNNTSNNNININNYVNNYNNNDADTNAKVTSPLPSPTKPTSLQSFPSYSNLQIANINPSAPILFITPPSSSSSTMYTHLFKTLGYTNFQIVDQPTQALHQLELQWKRTRTGYTVIFIDFTNANAANGSQAGVAMVQQIRNLEAEGRIWMTTTRGRQQRIVGLLFDRDDEALRLQLHMLQVDEFLDLPLTPEKVLQCTQ